MTVVLAGTHLTRDEVARVARDDEPVEFAEHAIERMTAARTVVEERLAAAAPAAPVPLPGFALQLAPS